MPEPRTYRVNSTPFDWTCPFCGRATAIVQGWYTRDEHWWNPGDHDGRVLVTHFIRCPSRACNELTVEADLFKSPGQSSVGDGIASWRLVPASDAKVFPGYVPQAVRDTYTEACLIRNLSPQASATLSRRCLQGMIRDFWSVKDLPTLKHEINAIQTEVEPDTWEAIEAVRAVGNIGAHMEQDVNLIIGVDPDEAAWLIWLVERLINDWYIGRKHRQNALREIAALRATKDAAKEQT